MVNEKGEGTERTYLLGYEKPHLKYDSLVYFQTSARLRKMHQIKRYTHLYDPERSFYFGKNRITQCF